MKLICDVMLGKLAKYLRILGFDAELTRSGYISAKIACHTCEDTFFLTRKKTMEGEKNTIIVHSDRAFEQVAELSPFLRNYYDSSLVLSRCIECNVLLDKIPREDVEQLVPEFIFHTCTTFMICRSCRKVYWPGSHTERMHELISLLEKEGDSPNPPSERQ